MLKTKKQQHYSSLINQKVHPERLFHPPLRNSKLLDLLKENLPTSLRYDGLGLDTYPHKVTVCTEGYVHVYLYTDISSTFLIYTAFKIFVGS